MENKESNFVLVGDKEFMQYIKSIEHLMRKKGMKEIVIKARGKHMGKAISLAEASKTKFLKDLNVSVENIKTETEKIEKDGEEHFVSCISIDLISK
jgi:DNA-binding protein